MDNKKKEIINLYLLYFLSIIVIYKTPIILGSFYQLFLLYVFSKSNKEYFWLAFIFLIESNPGGLFLAADVNNTFSFWSNSPFGVLFFWLFFLLIAFQKAQKENVSNDFFLKRNITVLFTYFLILVLVFGVYKIPPLLRMLTPWLLIYIFRRLIRREEDYARLFGLIMAFVPFVLMTQIFSMAVGGTFSNLFGGLSSSIINYKSIEEVSTALRPVDGIYIPYLAMIGSSVFLVMRTEHFSKNYLYLMLGLSFFSIFLTATRSWMIAGVFILLVVMLLISKNPLKLVSNIAAPTLVLILLFNFVPLLKKQSQMAIKRYETIEMLAEGDMTAGGTLKRFDERGPRVMKKFYQSPVIGWGYGKDGKDYDDGHVGHQNLLMHTGVIGYAIWVFFWISFIFKLYNRTLHLPPKNELKHTLLILIANFIGIHLINISTQWFNYLISFTTGFMLCILFCLADYVYWKARAHAV